MSRVAIRVLAPLLAILSVLAVAGVVAAHPLGNFTINHYAGIRVEPDRILLDVVVDQAEIPTFQARQEADADEDGELSDSEVDAARERGCAAIAADLTVLVDGARLEPRLTMAGLAFPPGAGGLSTMRLVCGFDSSLDSALRADTTISFRDASFGGRIGWREIVVVGSGVTLTPTEGELRAESVSARLTDYPDDLLEQALVDESIVFAASPGGPERPAEPIPDASPVAAADPGPAAGSTASPAPVSATGPNAAGAIPGGVGGEIPALFQTAELTPLVLLGSLLVAATLGAGHALTPGHGKTLMAAYLVGTRGTPIHALGLGLSVSASHTLGILVLAVVVVGAQGFLAPDLVVRVAPVLAALTIAGIGAWMLASEIRRRVAARTTDRAPGHGHVDGHEHENGEEHDRGGHDHGGAHTHGPGGHDHGHGPGGHSHSHGPTPGSTITWRSLFVLGLAGGLIPSTNALLILLGSIAAGRPTFGFVLVVAFGLGMALVMAGVGLVMIVARGRLDRFGGSSLTGRVGAWLPLGAAVLVLGLGISLTVQAVGGPTTL
jgi:ABC-type nickel/cobalt efflux system permease component RcnA